MHRGRLTQSYATGRGTTLVEVIAATAILVLTLAGVSNGFLAFTLNNRQSQQAGGSIAAARLVLDRLRLSDVATLPSAGREICNPDTNFTCEAFSADLQQIDSVIVTYCPEISPSYCIAGEPSIRHIQVEVLGTEGDGDLDIVFTAETVFSTLRDL